jgi:hypothetical protein
VFEGGFLGLDNIGVFDRSSALPTGGYLEQADGTAWMAFYCQNMLEIALELAADRSGRLWRHGVSSSSSTSCGSPRPWTGLASTGRDVGRGRRLLLRRAALPGRHGRTPEGALDGRAAPLCATTVIEPETLELVPDLLVRARRFLEHRPELAANITMPGTLGLNGRRLLSILNEEKLRRILRIHARRKRVPQSLWHPFALALP